LVFFYFLYKEIEYKPDHGGLKYLLSGKIHNNRSLK